MYGSRMRFRPAEEVAAEVAKISGKAVVFWDDNLGVGYDPAQRR